MTVMHIENFSPFAQFIFNSKGFDFVSPKGKDLDKWEAFEIMRANGLELKRGDVYLGNLTVVRVRESKLYRP